MDAIEHLHAHLGREPVAPDRTDRWSLRSLARMVAFDAQEEKARLAVAALDAAAACLGQRDGQQVARSIFDSLVASSERLRLCWAWFGASSSQVVMPQVVSGPDAHHVRDLRIDRDFITDMGPVMRAMRGEKVAPINIHAVGGSEARSVLAVPLRGERPDQAGVFLVYASRPDYFTAIGTDVFVAVGRLISAALARAGTLAELERAACVDVLTGMHNRRHAEAALGEIDRRTERRSEVCALVIDIDHFKRVNDGHGHSAGDEALRVVAAKIRASVRADDGVSRWGGEEFLVWLEGAAIEDALRVAEKIRARIFAAPLVLPSGQSIQASVSVGVAQRCGDEPMKRLVERADKALYHAKTTGRNRVAAYSRAMESIETRPQDLDDA